MAGSRMYTSPGAFPQALEERLKTISRPGGTDFQRLCRQVAFDRFLARLVSEPTGDWILKGGYAMELRSSQQDRPVTSTSPFAWVILNQPSINFRERVRAKSATSFHSASARP